MSDFDILGVSSSASADEIKKAYRALVRANHPDSNSDKAAASAVLLNINLAKERIDAGTPNMDPVKAQAKTRETPESFWTDFRHQREQRAQAQPKANDKRDTYWGTNRLTPEQLNADIRASRNKAEVARRESQSAYNNGENASTFRVVAEAIEKGQLAPRDIVRGYKVKRAAAYAAATDQLAHKPSAFEQRMRDAGVSNLHPSNFAIFNTLKGHAAHKSDHNDMLNADFSALQKGLITDKNARLSLSMSATAYDIVEQGIEENAKSAVRDTFATNNLGTPESRMAYTQAQLAQLQKLSRDNGITHPDLDLALKAGLTPGAEAYALTLASNLAREAFNDIRHNGDENSFESATLGYQKMTTLHIIASQAERDQDLISGRSAPGKEGDMNSLWATTSEVVQLDRSLEDAKVANNRRSQALQDEAPTGIVSKLNGSLAKHMAKVEQSDALTASENIEGNNAFNAALIVESRDAQHPTMAAKAAQSSFKSYTQYSKDKLHLQDRTKGAMAQAFEQHGAYIVARAIEEKQSRMLLTLTKQGMISDDDRAAIEKSSTKSFPDQPLSSNQLSTVNGIIAKTVGDDLKNHRMLLDTQIAADGIVQYASHEKNAWDREAVKDQNRDTRVQSQEAYADQYADRLMGKRTQVAQSHTSDRTAAIERELMQNPSPVRKRLLTASLASSREINDDNAQSPESLNLTKNILAAGIIHDDNFSHKLAASSLAARRVHEVDEREFRAIVDAQTKSPDGGKSFVEKTIKETFLEARDKHIIDPSKESLRSADAMSKLYAGSEKTLSDNHIMSHKASQIIGLTDSPSYNKTRAASFIALEQKTNARQEPQQDYARAL